MMNMSTVRRKIKDFAQQYWGMEFNLPVNLNGRLTRALGYYKSRRNRQTGVVIPVKIDIAKRLLENYDEETIDGVIKHELCHWALSVQGKPFQDGHPVFERELRRIGAPSTNVIQYSGEIHQVKCKNCGKIVGHKKNYNAAMRIIESARYHVSNCCRARLEYAGMKVVGMAQEIRQARQAEQEVAAAIVTQAPTPVRRPQQPVVLPQRLNSSNEQIVEIGPRGVTNKQMIPAMRKALDRNSVEDLNYLKNKYASVFAGSIRYLGNNYMAKLKELGFSS